MYTSTVPVCWCVLICVDPMFYINMYYIMRNMLSENEKILSLWELYQRIWQIAQETTTRVVVFVFGASGSGKNIYSPYAGTKHGFHHCELDALLYGISILAQRRQKVQTYLDTVQASPDSYVFEGIYRQERMNDILSICSHIIILRVNLATRLWRLTKRTLWRMLGLRASYHTSNLATLLSLRRFSFQYHAEKRETDFCSRVDALGLVDRTYRVRG